ncbi:MAG: sirohydrochlorin chelatase [Alphaproteobacteria bacterium]|nr:sirohydrochlorin chelatase [Alphaproteobacteria bacterium]
MGKLGVMVCGHGSRDVGAVDEFNQLVTDIAGRLPHLPVESGFLEFAHPVIRDGLDSLRNQGVDHILAVPGMLFAAGHVKNDVPSVLNQYAHDHGVKIAFGRDLGIDPKLLKAARIRIDQALSAVSEDIPRDQTLLAVIGRGTSDPDANGNVSKLARMLWEGTGVGWTEVGYSGVAHPRVDAVLERASRLGFKRILVFPYFLFTGVLVRRIYDQTDEVAARHPEIDFIKAGYLNNQPLVVDAFVERIEGIQRGDVDMNCLLCKYREQIIGHEGAVGAPQEGHHHHVEGIGTDGHHHHHHGHGHHHDDPASAKAVSETTAAE